MEERMRMRPLEPVTPEGERAVALAREVAARLRVGAQERDRAARFDPAPVRMAIDCGLGAATVGAEHGGGGVVMPSDVMAVASALATGDGSVALVVNMHLGAVRGLEGARSVPFVASLLDGVVAGQAWVSAAVTEAGTNYFNPRATLRQRSGGWTLDGEKVFATGSPMATHLVTNTRVVGGDHDGRLAAAFVPVDAPGVEVYDDWDGMGMRASGSGRVRFDAAVLDDDQCFVSPAGPVGTFSVAALVNRAMGNVANLAAMCGLAEAAALVVGERLTSEARVVDAPLALRPTVRQSYGQLLVDLHRCQSVLRDLGRRCDEITARALEAPAPAGGGLELDEAHALMAEFQAAKVITNTAAIEVVSRSMELGGGSAYLGHHELSRLYRDVRAGPFMQPFTPHESLGYIGAVGLDVDPDPES
jgi:alkylation response protein AidB-like acyl-CoA dehydrogenase